MPKYDKNFYTILAISIVVFVVVTYFVAKPIVVDILAKYQTLSQKDQELTALEEEKNADIKLSQNRNIINGMYQKMLLFLPENLASGDFIAQIEEMAIAANQNLINVVIKPELQNQPAQEETTTASKTTAQKSAPAASKISAITLKQNTFSLSEIGSFPDLVSFMENMQIMDRLHSLQNISLAINPDNSLETKIEGTIYYKPQVSFSGDAKLTPSDENKINDLYHFGEIITPASAATSGRTNPFISP